MMKHGIFWIGLGLLVYCIAMAARFDRVRRKHHTQPVAAPEPTALVDPLLTEHSPARAQLGEPASAALSASDQADDSPFLPEAQRQVSLLDLQGDVGDWVRVYVKEHPNGPWIKIPKDARKDQLESYAAQMKQIVDDWQVKNESFKVLHGDDLIAFSEDPRVRQNDRDRQAQLKNALNSIWPGSMK